MRLRWPTADDVLRVVEPLVYARRRLALLLLFVFTAVMALQAFRIGVDAGFGKQLPRQHAYIQTLEKYRDTFGGADLLIVALINENGDIYNEEFLTKLQDVHNAVFFLPGVDQARVKSLFSPDTRYLEVVEGGFSGGRVIPADYQPGEKAFAAIKQNVANAGIIGRLVAVRQNGAMVAAELLENDPVTGERLDYLQVAKDLEEKVRALGNDQLKVHIIGFAKVVGDVTDAATQVIVFFALALLLTAALLWLYCGSFKLSLLPLTCSLVAVIWEFGLLRTFGFGLDPFAILVPFLVLSIGVSHGVQMVNSWTAAVAEGHNSLDASVLCFRRLAIPGAAALITDVVGFATIYWIEIEIIQEMAINAAFGVAAIIITNKLLMPIMLSYAKISNLEKFQIRQARREAMGNKLWHHIAKITTPKNAKIVVVICLVLLGVSLWKGQDLRIGDFHAGVPELRPDSRYNKDSAAIASNFAVGTDLLKVIVETEKDGCLDYEIMESIDHFAWQMQNVAGVQSVASLPQIGRMIHGFWREGDPKWRVVSRNHHVMVQSVGPVPSSSGLLNANCSLMPVLIFTEDHKAETIKRIVQQVEAFNAELQASGNARLNFALASGNLGVMAATNEVIEANEKPILGWVYVVVILMCWLSFRSAAGVFCVVLPLSLVSFMTYAVMAWLEIGMKVATLPVVALAVGIGVDYGIYIYSVLDEKLKAGLALKEAYLHTLQTTGKAVIFTGIALGCSVCTWLLSDLQFQIDMGILLVFMFVANMFGAILVLPALAYFFARR